MSNRRYLPRLRCRLRLQLQDGGPLFTADLSPGGFAAELLRVPRPGTTVHGTLPFGGQEFPFTGQVMWAKAGEPRLNLRGRVGVRFTGIANGYYEAYQAAAVSRSVR
ncbi:PilZ domain-containing protein [Aggregicoccus sp. 17bor-14]|uniref:PilZ domain-containing protein n=1 Tax=Myxococcaceae TaxID=31 RepID=UPI00129C2438|nr:MULTISPECIES: PilZ domain-containing protein [Myxococcaceae]MBF5046159.1 PilZ domain-containing protein [Simulacricoccus sp. 17bor-14]MRI91885.1 PilZ domain-containing protein [Aggregicoccus sp. 17bor-14]